MYSPYISASLIWVAMVATACTAQVATRPKIQPHAIKGTRLITLGTGGGPVPMKDRSQCSNLLVVNGTRYLIDAGDNVTRRIVQSDSNFRQIGTVFITHPHSDHTMGLAMVMVSAWEFQRPDPIDIYGPPGIQALVNGVLQYLTVNAEIRWAEGKTSPMAKLFRAHEVQPGLVFRDNNVRVTAVENTHFHFPVPFSI